jgi:succinoglycan biosynthesis protein ExoU
VSDTRTAIIIAAFNAEATLDRAVESALAQPETMEVCIVDDASTDQTAALAKAWAARDARVRLLVNEANLGPAASRNRAIEGTTAPWLTVLDADDYMLDGRLTRLFCALGDADFIADALMRTQENALSSFTTSALTFEQFVLGNLGKARGPLDLGFLKPLFSRAFLDRHGLRYQGALRLGEDYEFYARALALGAKFRVGGPAGYVSVERTGSLSKVHSEGDLERLRDCDDALAAVRPLSRAEGKALRRHWHSVDCRLQWRLLIGAVKARDAMAAAKAFRSPQAATYLAARLTEQAILRGAHALAQFRPSVASRNCRPEIGARGERQVRDKATLESRVASVLVVSQLPKAPAPNRIGNSETGH